MNYEAFFIAYHITGFIFVQHLRGLLGQLCQLEICFLSTPRQMPQTITNISRCFPQILSFDIAEVLVSFLVLRFLGKKRHFYEKMNALNDTKTSVMSKSAKGNGEYL